MGNTLCVLKLYSNILGVKVSAQEIQLNLPRTKTHTELVKEMRVIMQEHIEYVPPAREGTVAGFEVLYWENGSWHQFPKAEAWILFAYRASPNGSTAYFRLVLLDGAIPEAQEIALQSASLQDVPQEAVRRKTTLTDHAARNIIEKQDGMQDHVLRCEVSENERSEAKTGSGEALAAPSLPFDSVLPVSFASRDAIQPDIALRITYNGRKCDAITATLDWNANSEEILITLGAHCEKRLIGNPNVKWFAHIGTVDIKERFDRQLSLNQYPGGNDYLLEAEVTFKDVTPPRSFDVDLARREKRQATNDEAGVITKACGLLEGSNAAPTRRKKRKTMEDDDSEYTPSDSEERPGWYERNRPIFFKGINEDIVNLE